MPELEATSGWTAWHPPLAVLELVELVLSGALPQLPDGIPAPDPQGKGLIIEDAEGTPVAAISPERRLGALRPFAHGPLRSHRLTPAQVRTRLQGRATQDSPDDVHTVLAVPVSQALSAKTVRKLRERIENEPGAKVLWLVLVGADRPVGGGWAMTPPALLRATRVVAHELEDESVVVPLALPAGHDNLFEEIAAAYGATEVVRPTEAGRSSSHPSRADLHEAYATEVRRASQPRHRRGLVVFFTGLSGSGKSTVAKALAERILDRGVRTVSLLDGDEVRRLLSSGLGFSAEDRAVNIARIGFVAAEIARHGGLAVAAPIAPFADGRAQVREMVTAAGGDLVLVHVATPLAECERRDRKGLYARARAGEIPEFTGISSPYQTPDDAEVVIDTTGREIGECVDVVWNHLERQGYLVDVDEGVDAQAR